MTVTQTEERVLTIEELESAAEHRALAPVEERIVPEAPPSPPSGGAWAAVFGAGVAIIWVAGAAAYLLGYAGLDALRASTPTQMAGLGFILLAPALFVLLAGFAARQMIRFGGHAGMVASAARRLTQPVSSAQEETRSLSTALASEVDRVNSSLDGAVARLGAMEQVIRHHSESLTEVAEHAGAQSRSLIDDLKTERQALTALAEMLDEKAKLIADAIGEQSRMVARAAELADGAATEGRAKIEAGAEALTAASTTVLDRSDKAAEAFEDQRAKLATLSDAIVEQRRALTGLYKTQRDEMEQAEDALREEQKRIAASLDFHRAELGALIKVAAKGAQDMTDATRTGSASMREAVEEAIAQAHKVGEVVEQHSQALAERQSKRLAALDEAAERAKEASEAAAAAMEIQAAAIRERVEQLGETTYQASLRTEAAFERRLDEATEAIDKLTQLADDADSALADRFDKSLDSWRARLDDVESRLDAMAVSLAAAPESAKHGLQELETAVGKGIDGLRSAARSAAEEAREIDAALQARMRHNYELLSEFVLRMGAVAGGAGAPPFGAPMEAAPEPAAERPAPPEDAQRPRRRFGADEPGLRWRDIVSGLRETESGRQAALLPEAPAAPDAGASLRNGGPGLRRPGAEDEPEADPEPAPEPAAEARAGEAAPRQDPELYADPDELSSAAARDAAHARRSAGIAAMRDSVREHAGEHVAELSFALDSDPDLRSRIALVVDEEEEEASAAARRDEPEPLIELFATERGRRYLLLSAALGDA